MDSKYLNEEWTAYVVGRLHLFRIKRSDLAYRCNYSEPYISTILNCNKEFMSDEAKEKTKQHILKNLKDMETEIMSKIREEEAEYVHFIKTRTL